MNSDQDPGDDYRPCVAILLFNAKGDVLVAERNDVEAPAWQLPQGGIDEGETPVEAARREMLEEIGTDKAEFLAENGKWTPYDLPARMRTGHFKSRWRGQKVRLTAWLFTGTDRDINLDTDDAEFRAWRWVSLESLPGLIVPFKRALYDVAVEDFSAVRDRLREKSYQAAPSHDRNR